MDRETALDRASPKAEAALSPAPGASDARAAEAGGAEAGGAEAIAPEAPIAVKQGLLQKHGLKLVVSLVLGAGIAWVLSRGGLPLLPPASTFASLRAWTVPVYVLTLALVHWFRAIRWRHLLRAVGEVSNRNVVVVSWIAFGAILISPLRSGEVVRPYLITKRSSIRLWEATGTIGAERVIDGLVLSLILFLGLQLSTPLSPLPDHVGDLPVPAAAVPGAAYTALAIFFSAFAVMAIFFFARDFARRMTHAAGRIISHRLADRLAGIVERVADGLRFLPSPRHLVPFMAETLLYWFINAAGVWLLGWGCGLDHMTLAQAAVTMGCLGIGILVPSGPGYFGAFQLSTYMALGMFFKEEALKGPGAAFVFLLYATQVGFHLVAMVIGLLLDRQESAR
jgi:glycosyltransferase 2 family protein